MRKTCFAAACLSLLGCAGRPPAAAAPLLERLVGEWEYEAEAVTGPGQPPVKLKGSESGRLVDGWAVLEGRGESPGGSFTSQLCVGFNPGRGRYVATWASSQSPDVVRYEGTVAGNVLTLETELLAPAVPGKLSKFRDVIEIESDDRKVLRSMIEMDGKWVAYLTSRYRRPRK